MMVSRLKIRGTIKDALSVTKKMFSNELFSVPYIRVFPVTFPLVISSPPAMKARGDVPFGPGLPGRRPGSPALSPSLGSVCARNAPASWFQNVRKPGWGYRLARGFDRPGVARMLDEWLDVNPIVSDAINLFN
jgi:hypothetical protein